MKKNQLSESFKALLLSFVAMISFAGNALAQVTVSEPDDNGVVTITTTEAGQIGSKGQWEGNYVWASDVTESQKATIKAAKGIKLVGDINSADVKALVEGCKNVSNWVYWSMLDMGKATFVDKLAVDVEPWGTVKSHCFVSQTYYQIHCTSLSLPKLKEGSAVPANFSSVIYDLKSVTIPEGYTEIGDKAFSNNCSFKNLTFPSTLRKIGHMAFVGGINDVYFLGKNAPEVAWDAFDTKAYLNNNSIIRPDYANGVYTATRDNYYKENYCAAILHLRNDLTPAQRAAFTDITRKYHVFSDPDRGIQSSDESAEYNDNGVLSVKVGENVATKYGNMYVSAAGVIPYYKNGDNTAYYDTNLGSQYIWPSQIQFCRSYACANSGLLWDGKTSIGDGIRNAGGSYSGDGSEYSGLHEFVLVSYDITGANSPQDWDFNTVGGSNWYTICVPVNMTVKQVRETFGEDTQVCKFNKVTRNSDDKVRLYFTDEQCKGKDDENALAIVANEAYMICPSKYKDANTKFELPNYEVSDKVVPVPTVHEVKDEATRNRSIGTHKYTFVGNYQQTVDANGNVRPIYMPQYSYYLGNAGNNVHKLFFQVGKTGKWKPYTCVVLVDNEGTGNGWGDYDTFFSGHGSVSAQAKSCSTSIGGDNNGETTGVESIEIVAGENHDKSTLVYNINGQLASNRAEGLHKGVYIQNGKKFVVK